MTKNRQKMSGTPQQCSQLQQAQYIKEIRQEERKKAINLYAASDLTLPDKM